MIAKHLPSDRDRPSNISRRGFLRAAGVTALISVPALIVPSRELWTPMVDPGSRRMSLQWPDPSRGETVISILDAFGNILTTWKAWGPTLLELKGMSQEEWISQRAKQSLRVGRSPVHSACSPARERSVHSTRPS